MPILADDHAKSVWTIEPTLFVLSWWCAVELQRRLVVVFFAVSHNGHSCYGNVIAMLVHLITIEPLNRLQNIKRIILCAQAIRIENGHIVCRTYTAISHAFRANVTFTVRHVADDEPTEWKWNSNIADLNGSPASSTHLHLRLFGDLISAINTRSTVNTRRDTFPTSARQFLWARSRTIVFTRTSELGHLAANRNRTDSLTRTETQMRIQSSRNGIRMGSNLFFTLCTNRMSIDSWQLLLIWRYSISSSSGIRRIELLK